MPNVNEFLRSAVAEMPDSFVETNLAIRFLDEQGDIQQKEKLALELLEAVAQVCECHDTWETLVKQRLVAAEKAMRYLLPAHRDHILHSAHLYLLGLALYLKMLRPDATLMAVIADTAGTEQPEKSESAHTKMNTEPWPLTRLALGWSCTGCPPFRWPCPSPPRCRWQAPLERTGLPVEPCC